MPDADITLRDLLQHMQGMKQELQQEMRDLRHELRHGMQRLEGRMDRFEGRMDIMQSGIGEIDQRLDRLEIAFLPIPKKVAMHDRRIRSLEKRFG